MMTPEAAQALIAKDARNKEVLFPYLNGEDLNSRLDQSPSRWVINFSDWPIEKAMEYPDCFRIVEEKVKPERAANADRRRREIWWQFTRPTLDLYSAIAGMKRVLVTAEVSKHVNFAFRPPSEVFSHMLIVFPLSSFDAFAVVQSTLHEAWCREKGSTLETRFRYTPTDCFETFSFPASHDGLETVGDHYQVHRQQIMLTRKEGLTKTYNRFHDPEEASADIQKLRELHVEMDRAVAVAYGWTDLSLDHGFHETKQGVRYTISEAARRLVLARLLTLNHERYTAEVKQGLHDTKAKRTATSKPKATAAKPKPAPEAPTLFDDGDVLDTTFPKSPRDKVLCGLFCDLVAAEPNLRFDAYEDALMIAVQPGIYEGLLPRGERKPFMKLVEALKVADQNTQPTLPWYDLKLTLLDNGALAKVGGASFNRGSQFDEVRPGYPECDPKAVELIRKVAATLREFQNLGQGAPAEGQRVLSKHAETKRAQTGAAP